MKTKLQKWGNSQGIRLPKSLLAPLGISEGAIMEVRSDRGAIILRPAKLERKIRGRHRIEDLMGTMPKNYKPQEMKWGVRGKEVW